MSKMETCILYFHFHREHVLYISLCFSLCVSVNVIIQIGNLLMESREWLLIQENMLTSCKIGNKTFTYQIKECVLNLARRFSTTTGKVLSF
jgi:hypothetical protein